MNAPAAPTPTTAEIDAAQVRELVKQVAYRKGCEVDRLTRLMEYTLRLATEALVKAGSPRRTAEEKAWQQGEQNAYTHITGLLREAIREAKE